jgi:hypothetical protein
VVVDSNDPRAIFLTGNATVTAAETDVTGGLLTVGNASLSGELNHEAATPDPLGLALPPAPATMFAAVHYSGSAPLTLAPGTYVGGIFIDGSGPVTLLPGVYYMKGGGFTVTGQGSVTGSGVLIANAPSGPSDTIMFAGQGAVTLSAPTGLTGSLAPYNGIAIFQDPATDNPVTITGQASLTMTGVLYAPNALLKIDGHGNVVVSAFSAGHLSLGGEVIVFDALVTGNGDLTINADLAVGGGASAPAGHGILLPLGGGQQADGNSPSSAWGMQGGESTASAHQTVLDQLFSSNSGGTGADLSGKSKGVQPNRSMAPWADPLSGQLVDELVSCLVQVA